MKNEIDRKLRFKKLHRYLREDCWHRKSSRSLKKRGTNRREQAREREREREKSFRIEFSFQHFTFGIRFFLEQIHLPVFSTSSTSCSVLLFSSRKMEQPKTGSRDKNSHTKNTKTKTKKSSFTSSSSSSSGPPELISLWPTLSSLCLHQMRLDFLHHTSPWDKSRFHLTQTKRRKKIDETRTFLRRWTKSDTEEMQIHTHTHTWIALSTYIERWKHVIEECTGRNSAGWDSCRNKSVADGLQGERRSSVCATVRACVFFRWSSTAVLNMLLL